MSRLGFAGHGFVLAISEMKRAAGWRMLYVFTFLVLLAAPLVLLSAFASARWAFGLLAALGAALLALWLWRRYGGPFPRDKGSPMSGLMRDLYWAFVYAYLLATGIYTGLWLVLMPKRQNGSANEL